MTVFHFRKKCRHGRKGNARGKHTGQAAERGKEANIAAERDTLFGLRRGESAVIQSVNVEGGALARLTALGFLAGAKVEVLAFSLFRSSVLVACSSVRVSMRRALAVRIAVQRGSGKEDCKIEVARHYES